MSIFDVNSTDKVEVWSDDRAEKEAGKELYAEGWGAVVAGRWMMGVTVASMCLVGYLGYRLSQVQHIDLSSMPIAVVRMGPNGQYVDTAVARGNLIDRDQLVPERLWSLIRAFREVVPSAITMKDNRAFLGEHLDAQPFDVIKAYLTDNPPEKLWTDKGLMRVPRMTAILPQQGSSGDTWTVLWAEELMMAGRPTPVQRFDMSASITVRFSPPTDTHAIVTNPAGIRIAAITWNERERMKDDQSQ
jgi:type IV secretory pathway TrbF-like protein